MKLFLLFFLSLCIIGTWADDESTSTTTTKPYATVSALSGPSVVFSEVFDSTWEDRWVITQQPEFQGKWRVDEGVEPYTVKGDKGLIVDSEARKHGIAAPFKKVLDNKNKDLFVQYELRLQKELDCGGAYIKLLTASSLPSSLTKFDNSVPYTVMFGPDKCGSLNKIHFIIRHKNPITGLYEEKHLKNPPPMETDRRTHLYGLHIFQDNRFSVLVDGKEVRGGNLLEDFEPAFNPPKEVDDPSDKKPADWVDEEKIADPDAVKPDDWDETLPATIVDENDMKPDDWFDDEPQEIPDPDVTKPDDWDDEIDGEWAAPSILNPKCAQSGCGEWKPRLIPNPLYKGKWRAPMIDNPAYKGEWKPRQIPNPHFFVDDHPHNLEPIGAIGIELWTMKDGIMFDNILITHDQDIIDDFTSATWAKKSADEQTISDTEAAKNTPSLTQTLNSVITSFLDYISDGQNMMVVIGSALAAVIIPLLLCLLYSGKKKQTRVQGPVASDEEEEKEKKEEEEEKKEKETEKGVEVNEKVAKQTEKKTGEQTEKAKWRKKEKPSKINSSK